MKFDFISVNYVLCLADNLVQILETVHDILTDQGVFFVIDTDYAIHPWMLYVMEHNSFFTKEYLKDVLSRFGFKILDVNFEHEEKEIAYFCSNKAGLQRQSVNYYQINKKIYERKVEYLNSVIDTVESYVEENRNIGIFGTSVAGVWISELIAKEKWECREKNIFYIEEDEEALQKKTGANDYPICRLEDIRDDAVIFLPFPKYIAESIKRRCERAYGNCEFVVFES